MGRGYHRVLDALKELRAERDELGRVDEIPIDLSDFEDRKNTAGTGDYVFSGVPRDVAVKFPTSSNVYPALDCGAELDRILLLPDTHSPFHDRWAWDAAMSFARKWRPTTLVHVGDFADFYSVSDHSKDPSRAHNLLEECKTTKALRSELDDLGASRKFFCAGNHEYRLDRYVRDHAPALIGAVSIDQLLGLTEHGWVYSPYGKHIRIGDLHCTHDVGKCGKGAISQTAIAVGHNVVIGHSHRLGCEYFGTVLGERYVSASLGCLLDIAAADYKSEIEKAPWTHGFGTALMTKEGNFELQLHPIVNGRVIGA